MIKYAIFDLDDTLLDFKRGEREGLTKIMTKYGVSDLKQGFDTYTKINHQVWEAIEQGQARDALLNTRFSKAFNLLGIKVDGAAVEAEYRSSLDTNFYKLQGVDELLSDLKAAGVHLLVGTNGVKETQLRRLKGSGLEHYFEDYFISEDIGFAKPDKRFFEPMFKKYGNLTTNAVMVGDRLQADVLGAKRAQLNSIWYNPQALPVVQSYQPTYVANSFKQIKKIILNA
ncbi:YjjG family noncanonical pyrimidine nucleotidase [Pediococcus pentosaceus]|uniref:YjjG family noncanonical pyrimidine nucleotidase n=1 Tax=Pediococcus pentosaceus TaxID=1255 RepID=UPI0006D89419|nr:YjjG family noncanonical pyrimidine nucleotidase [Pediococcus pentosaceus]ANI98269.1 noncanonical pyrimidine nucleotidase, YjjG family [Pediococcus pentosaceus]ASC08861.1 Putative HAD-hydrolase YfnB [Pediococcus pentosaceus]AVL02692.1 noncanonical pyrimidine nucleotidase, YjjG family [Pediococcus pentosaceus]KQB82193.1 haloacid dehalogenase [Pediococcus pentosaceus]MBF7113423.1 noncanonical pyrimidine nucleotidase, YjjG family [Pediococcus pentosaceus]